MNDRDERPKRRDPRAEQRQRAERRTAPMVEPVDPGPPAPAADRPLRRDPRAELQRRVARTPPAAALPPAPEAAPAAANRPLRRDPRAERGRRPERPAGQPGPAAGATAPGGGAAEPSTWVLVVPDALDGALSGLDRDAIAAARLVADGLDAGLVAAVPPGLDGLAGAGVDRVATLPIEASAFAPTRRLACLQALLAFLSPRRIVLPDSPNGGGDLGRRLAVAHGMRIATGLVRVAATQLLRRAHGGSRDQILADAQILLVLPEAADPKPAPAHPARPLALEPAVLPEEPVTDLGLVAADPDSVPLAEADLIVSAGVGVTDWSAFHAVAQALGAAVAGTRAVCDAGHLPRSRQVGASGTLVQPRVYLAFGISGAPQHLQGIAQCEHVVAVNTDLHAAMIKRADLAIVADAQEVMPALRARVEAGS